MTTVSPRRLPNPQLPLLTRSQTDSGPAGEFAAGSLTRLSSGTRSRRAGRSQPDVPVRARSAPRSRAGGQCVRCSKVRRQACGRSHGRPDRRRAGPRPDRGRSSRELASSPLRIRPTRRSGTPHAALWMTTKRRQTSDSAEAQHPSPEHANQPATCCASARRYAQLPPRLREGPLERAASLGTRARSRAAGRPEEATRAPGIA